MKTTKVMMKAVLGVVAAMSMASAANAQDVTGVLVRMALNLGGKVIDAGIASVVKAVKEADAPAKKQGDDAATAGQAGKAEAPAPAASASNEAQAKAALAGKTKVMVDGVEMEVPTHLLTLAAPGADKSASAEALKTAMGTAISEQAKADREVALKQQTSGVPLVGAVMAPMMVPAKMATGSLGGIVKLMALAGAASKLNAALSKHPVEVVAGNSDAAKSIRQVVSEATADAVKGATEAASKPTEAKQAEVAGDAEGAKAADESPKSGG